MLVLLAAVWAWHCGEWSLEKRPGPETEEGSLSRQLVAAVKDRDPSAVKSYLDRGADPNSRNSYGDSALIWAVERRAHGLVAELLNRGADPNLAGSYGRAPLHWACAAAESEMVKMLVAKGAEVNHLDEGSFTGLMRSAAANDEISLRYLLKNGADPTILNMNGQSALSLAIKNGSLDVIEPLVLAGSDLDSGGENGRTVLQEILGLGYERFLLTEPVLQKYPNLRARVTGMYREVVKNSDEQPRWNLPAIERRIHQLVNQERTQRGLQPLKYDEDLAAIARGHSRDMARSGFFSHENPRGDGPTERARAAGYAVRRDMGGGQFRVGIGENIFQGHQVGGYSAYVERGVRHVENHWLSGEQLAVSCVEGWMKSPGHRDNILTADYMLEGIGIAVAEDQKVYVTQNFY